jgi:hypothetical protein
MKADGIEYDERMELLESVTYPKPLAELLDATFEMYRRGHPWVADHELSPKAVVRDMYSRAMNFTEYIAFYNLARSEGLVLRYLADTYKALKQTVPEDAKTEDLQDLIEWLGELVRQVDSSLLDEWEKLRDPGAPIDETPPPVSRNLRAFRVLVRNELFRRIELASLRRWDLLSELDPTLDWQGALEPYFDEHDSIGIGPDARGPALLMITEEEDRWLVRQIIDDPAGDHDWGISAEVDLSSSDDNGVAVVTVTSVDQL